MVLIDNRQKKKKLNLTKISGITSRILNLLGEKKAEVSLTFVTNSAIAVLNKKYLSCSRATDVLAFPIREIKMGGEGDLLGDVVISIEKALSQAKEWGATFEQELTRLIIHGILHLIGYKDKQKKDKIKMFNMQEKILSNIYETA